MKIKNEEVVFLTDKTEEELSIIEEEDEPLSFSLSNRPRTQANKIPDRFWDSLTEIRGISLAVFVISVLVVLTATQVVLSSCNIKFDDTLLKALFDTGKVIISILIGYLFGNKVKQKEK